LFYSDLFENTSTFIYTPFPTVSFVCHNFVGLSDSAVFVGDIWQGTGADVEMQRAL
jgi:hypothetical protein